MKPLDPEAVQAFVLVAELGGFGRAGVAMGIAQSAVSLKIKQLEARLDRRLLDRTPRSVSLSQAGQAFMGPARALLAAHDQAIAACAVERRRLSIGISEHIVGPDLPLLLKQLTRREPGLTIEARVSPSRDLLADFEAGAMDGVIVFQHDTHRRDDEPISREPFGWFASPDFTHRPHEPLPIAVQPAPCGVRDMAVKALEGAGARWREAFVGGGVGTLAAAAEAGIAVAALARRVAPPGLVDVGERLGLPALPTRDLVLRTRAADKASAGALRSLAMAMRSRG